jgi:excisionase family DNA binding protein
MNAILSPATTLLFDACLKMTGGDRAAAAMLALVETMSNEKPAPKAAAPDELTVAEAAERLRCSEMTVYRLCREGKLAHRRIGVGRGVIRVRAADLDSFAPTVRTLPSDNAAKRRRYLGF